MDEALGRTCVRKTVVVLKDKCAPSAKALSDARLQPEGTSRGYAQTLHDVTDAAPSTPQDIATWYQTEGKSLPGETQEIAQILSDLTGPAVPDHAPSDRSRSHHSGLAFALHSSDCRS
jgi:hypothetical protein